MRSELPDTNILLLAIFPRGKQANSKRRRVNENANAMIAKVAEGKRVHVLDIGNRLRRAAGMLDPELLRDLLHLSEKGYAVWHEAVEARGNWLIGES